MTVDTPVPDGPDPEGGPQRGKGASHAGDPPAPDAFELLFAPVPVPASAEALVDLLARKVAARHRPGRVTVVGITGAVAVGKTTTAEALAAALGAARLTVARVVADGFLLPNRELLARGLAARKGFPESFDTEALYRALASLRAGRPAAIPGYSHRRYDVEPAVDLESPDVVILEGINVLQVPPAGPVPSDLVDIGIYLDADESDLRVWFGQRLQALFADARDDPGSYYHQWAGWNDEEVAAFASAVWEGINLPNLRHHIWPSRLRADVVVRLDGDHLPAGLFLRR